MPHDISLTWKESMKDPSWQKAMKGFVRKGYSMEEIAKQHQAWKSKQVRGVMSKSEK